ncbi:bifunctional UDP-N-acetylglucosamine diphosphorylase/glucosamine-1-phosphate N-acetyltransferase GlmU [bacterium endosymbiont of Pedicinus badii]|uniref:bifunctional UDP-N-acetylglucosamine diphosphorylase/glucosamine-1-phosphate N-acetyltransferase GlmU n=1 Tax=bacterium endosymbiont of Pedicinus badii TaxID=1719126 RepID=UPI0009B9FF70|nr:bifunctional UDP-N-acetylglucosamine diphosphorylase/glucosamine-1-phosphate N-acetyltransferase GlmU [bacterium endosymbiont of Pedicinus badii]OQM34066.1 hypothetical protein AOQ89_01775 [bacterium endosymbiont of Pedicinus badii]
MKKLNIVILCAGESKRMVSKIPKIFHKISGKMIVERVLNTAEKIENSRIFIVYSKKVEKLKKIFFKKKIFWIVQEQSLGTAHAIKVALPFLKESEEILVLYSDVPLVSYETIKKVIKLRKKCSISLLTAKVKYPKGYGRIIRKKRKIYRIIEENEIKSKKVENIKEIYTGIFSCSVKNLKRWIGKIRFSSKKENYLTKIISIANKENRSILSIFPKKEREVYGVNTKLHLIEIENILQKEKIKKLIIHGLFIANPDKFAIFGSIKYGLDVYIGINVILKGKILLGNNVRIEENCILKNVKIGDNTKIYSNCIIKNSHIEKNCHIGPFARIRNKNIIKENSKVGNFVEMKNTFLGKGSKVKHFSYLGDAKIGKKVNIGAGVVTCNYNGYKKQKTIIEDKAFIGSSSQIIAPIKIGRGAFIGAGTVVTKDVKNTDIVISRVKQFSIKKNKF